MWPIPSAGVSKLSIKDQHYYQILVYSEAYPIRCCKPTGNWIEPYLVLTPRGSFRNEVKEFAVWLYCSTESSVCELGHICMIRAENFTKHCIQDRISHLDTTLLWKLKESCVLCTNYDDWMSNVTLRNEGHNFRVITSSNSIVGMSVAELFQSSDCIQWGEPLVFIEQGRK